MSVSELDKIESEVARLTREGQFELVQRLLRKLRREDPAIRREKLMASARLVRKWASEPPDHDDAWWDDFDRELRENRLNFPVRDLGEDDG